jgi:steroid 5-alpha reductase family enzyme
MITIALAAAAAVSVVMAALWIVQVIRRDASLVDVAWTYSVGGLGICFAITGPGAPERRLLVGLLAGLWSLRLGTYLLVNRVLGKPEDGRYQELRRGWGKSANLRFFGFFQAQALVAVVFSLPFYLACLDPVPGLGPLDLSAAALWGVSVAGESIADRQLARHRSDSANRGVTCRSGLWRYSRHPNYFFEWLTWIAFALPALRAPYGWAALSAPALMLFLLFKVTGIPATEAHAVASRGDDYRSYQRATSAFVPWFPGKDKT